MKTPVSLPASRSATCPASSRASQATRSSSRCCGSSQMASRGEMPKNCGVELVDLRSEEAAAERGHLAELAAGRVVELAGLPAVGGQVAGGVDAVAQQVPEGVRGSSRRRESGSRCRRSRSVRGIGQSWSASVRLPCVSIRSRPLRGRGRVRSSSRSWALWRKKCEPGSIASPNGPPAWSRHCSRSLRPTRTSCMPAEDATSASERRLGGVLVGVAELEVGPQRRQQRPHQLVVLQHLLRRALLEQHGLQHLVRQVVDLDVRVGQLRGPERRQEQLLRAAARPTRAAAGRARTPPARPCCARRRRTAGPACGPIAASRSSTSGPIRRTAGSATRVSRPGSWTATPRRRRQARRLQPRKTDAPAPGVREAEQPQPRGVSPPQRCRRTSPVGGRTAGRAPRAAGRGAAARLAAVSRASRSVS